MGCKWSVERGKRREGRVGNEKGEKGGRGMTT